MRVSCAPQLSTCLPTTPPCPLQHVGWAPTFTLFGLAGMAAAAVSSLGLPAEGRRVAQPQAAVSQPAVSGSSPWRKPSRQTVLHMLLLCFTHSVIRQAVRQGGFSLPGPSCSCDGRHRWQGCLQQAHRHLPCTCCSHCRALPASAPFYVSPCSLLLPLQLELLHPAVLDAHAAGLPGPLTPAHHRSAQLAALAGARSHAPLPMPPCISC